MAWHAGTAGVWADGEDADRAELLRNAHSSGGKGAAPGVRTAEEIKAAYGRKRWGSRPLPRLKSYDLTCHRLVAPKHGWHDTIDHRTFVPIMVINDADEVDVHQSWSCLHVVLACDDPRPVSPLGRTMRMPDRGDGLCKPASSCRHTRVGLTSHQPTHDGEIMEPLLCAHTGRRGWAG